MLQKGALLVIFLYCFFYSLASIEIKPLRKINLSQRQDNFIKWPGSFVITVDDMIFVFDSKSSNIKIYDGSGKLVNVFGRNGMGPDEFLQPYLSTYNEPYIFIVDYGRQTIFIYKRLGRDNLKFFIKVFSPGMIYDLHLINENKFLFAGYKKGNNLVEYNLYEYDFKNNNYDFLLTSEESYGFNSKKLYLKEYDEKICYIGPFQFIDYTKDSIYLVWTGDIKIIKFDRKTRKYSFFGNKTKNYVQPYVSPEIKKAYSERKNTLIFKLQREMSYIRDIFVLKSNKIGLVYIGPFKNSNFVNVMLQIYSDNGDFLKEFELLKAKASHHYELFSYLKKDTNLIYIMDTETSKDFDQFYKIHEYRIEE